MGGAKNCPETPRQRMIGMMYLVLTAMLALNVSADIINGYVQVDDSLHNTIQSTKSNNDYMYQLFAAAMEQNPEKTKDWYAKALQVREVSDEMYGYIQNFKDEMVLMVDHKKAQKNATVRQINKKDDNNIPNQYGLNEGNGTILKEKLTTYREFMKEVTNGTLTADLDVTFPLTNGISADGEVITWEQSLFHEMPMCATMTMLTKFQNDIRVEEGRALRYLMGQTDASDLRVNKLEVHVIPKSEYVIRGGKYSAKIVLAAVDSTKRPEIYVNNAIINSNGVYEVNANSLGQQRYRGYISYLNNYGEMEQLPFEGSYIVTEPSITVSNTELDVMYRDHDNKFSISVPGFSSESLTVSATGASVKKNGSQWIIRPNGEVKKVEISVFADVEGKKQSMGTLSYRVQKLPDPKACFASGEQIYEAGSSVGTAKWKAADAKLAATYGKDAILNIPFEVTSFDIIIGSSNNPYHVNGNKIPAEQIKKITGTNPNTRIIFENIRAKSSEGAVLALDDLVLKSVY